LIAWNDTHPVPSVAATKSECNGAESWSVTVHGSEFLIKLSPDDAEKLAASLIDRARMVRQRGAQ